MNNEARIEELLRLLKKYQKSYYQHEAEISDSEFDALWDELQSLDPTNSLLKKIGSDISSETFEKAKHRMPMGSQEKAANPQEFETWAKKQDFSTFLVEYKLDGASIELQYENGIFTRAVTRGDGTIGDDITKNAKKMQGLILKLPLSLNGAVRGEVIMNHEVHKKYFSDKANCRNAANGLMKRKESDGCEHLQIICYDAYFPENQLYEDEEQKINWLKSAEFNTVPATICETAAKVTEYRAYIMDIRKDLPYDIDGLVVKNLALDATDIARNRPEKQIAYKFSLEEAVTIVRSVIWSENGATYTPIAEFDKVELAGTNVQKASLNNPNMIRTLQLKIGSHVIVTKRGEIIPKIESLVQNPADTKDISFPSFCSVCNTPLCDEGTRLYCPNPACKKRIHHRIEKWISVLDIRDFGETLIKRLFEQGRINNIIDLYTITLDELAKIERMGEKSARKVIQSRDSRQTVRLSQFIAGFDIEGIGETLVEKIIQSGYTTLDKMLAATIEDFAKVYGFAEISAKILADGLCECKAEMQKLLTDGYLSIMQTGELPLSGKSFCFTGELSINRSEAETLLKKYGASVKSSITKDLTYLVTNDPASGSSKNRKAQEWGITIINEKGFFDLLP